MTNKTKSLIAGVGCLTAACIWGFAFVVVKDSLEYVSAIYMMAFRFSIAAIGLFFICAKKIKSLNRLYWKNGIIMGFFFFVAYAFQTVGCDFTTPGKNAFLTTIYVILVPLISWPIYKTRPKWFVFVAAIIQLIGIGFLSLVGDGIENFGVNIGDILTLVCGIFYALQIVWQEKSNKDEKCNNPLLMTFIQCLFAAIFSWILAPFFNNETNRFTLEIQRFSWDVFRDGHILISIFYLGLLSTLVCFCLQNSCLKYIQSSIASLLLSFESVFGMLFSILFPVSGGKESLTIWTIFGCIFIFSAVIIAEVFPERLKK